jgi:beta-carotene ketolase (CrtW type)
LSDGNAGGMGWSVAILSAWLVSGVGLLSVDLDQLGETLSLTSGKAAGPWIEALLLVLAVLLRSFLHTGLFIVAHDAMHCVLRPACPEANARWGRLALTLYAGLPYGSCRAKHVLHHRFSGGNGDPDFHPAEGSGPGAALRWFIHFLGGYLSWNQMGRLLAGWGALGLLSLALTPTAGWNLLVFCILPLLLSSLQLFVFGTYLPHRSTDPESAARRPRSLELPVWLSLLTCYHFGYHWEHHQYPWLAWHELPGSRLLSRSDRVQVRGDSAWVNGA